MATMIIVGRDGDAEITADDGCLRGTINYDACGRHASR